MSVHPQFELQVSSAFPQSLMQLLVDSVHVAKHAVCLVSQSLRHESATALPIRMAIAMKMVVMNFMLEGSWTRAWL